MSYTRNTKSLKMLIDVYQHRLTVANRRVTQQTATVMKTRAELVERNAIVADLSEQMEQNWRYVELSQGTVDANALHSANRHRYWIDYDRQREAYYLELTYQELAEHLEELASRRKQVRKLKAKSDSLTQIVHKSKVAAESQRELHAEEEGENMRVMRQSNYVE